MDSEDKVWIQDQANQLGISMSEFVRQLIRDHRKKTEHHPHPSKVFEKYFGKEHGIELVEGTRFSYRPIRFPEEKEI